jgi:hypothetical protein
MNRLARRAFAWTTLSCLTFVARSTPAQPDATAQAAFAAGEAAFERNDYVAALDAFRRAYSRDPRDAVRFNIGICLERLGRFKEAVSELEAASRSLELSAEKRARATEEARLARRRLGTLRATTEPAGATLHVDGAATCQTPCSVELDPRSHRLTAKLGGREVASAVVIVPGETRSVLLRLPKPPPGQRRPVADGVQRSDAAFRLGALGWTGAGLAVAGVAGFVGFGLRARDLEREYAERPRRDTRDEGLRMQTWTNVSLGVALTGAALVGVDLLVLDSASAK